MTNPSPLYLPKLDDKTDSLALRLLNQSDYEGVLKAISKEQWLGWSEFSIPLVLEQIFEKTKSFTINGFPKKPWPISPSEPWPEIQKTNAVFVFLGVLIAQNILTEKQRMKVFEKAQSQIWPPIIEQLIRQDSSLSEDCWTKKIAVAYRREMNWFERLAAGRDWVSFKETLKRAPHLIPNLTKYISLKEIEDEHVLKYCLENGLTLNLKELSPTQLESNADFKLNKMLPILVWEKSLGTLDQKIETSLKWFYKKCEKGNIKEANKWLHLARSINDDLEIDWNKACGSFSLYNVGNDDRVKTLNTIQNWIQRLSAQEQSALIWLTWLNMGGKNLQQSHGLEPYRYSILSEAKTNFENAYNWLFLSKIEKDKIPSRSYFALEFTQFIFSKAGQEIISNYASEEELEILENSVKWIKEYQEKKSKTGSTFRSYVFLIDAFNHLTKEQRRNWVKRHGTQSIRFWIDCFQMESSDRHARPIMIGFLQNLLKLDAPWSYLSKEQENWLTQSLIITKDLNLGLADTATIEFEKAKLNLYLEKSVSTSQKLRI